MKLASPSSHNLIPIEYGAINGVDPKQWKLSMNCTGPASAKKQAETPDSEAIKSAEVKICVTPRSSKHVNTIYAIARGMDSMVPSVGDRKP